MIEMPFLRLRAEMGKLRTAMEKASKEYDQEKELYAGLEEELSRFEIMLSSTVELFTVQDKRKARTLAEEQLAQGVGAGTSFHQGREHGGGAQGGPSDI
jgi:hypothetical protein